MFVSEELRVFRILLFSLVHFTHLTLQFHICAHPLHLTGAAAKRICTYWRIRVEVFKHRAFLPLRIDERTGALCEADLEVLDTKAAAILPEDSKGRKVIMLDRSQSSAWSTKAAFLIIHHASDSEASMREGYVHIMRVGGYSGATYRPEVVSMVTELVNSGLPVAPPTILLMMFLPPFGGGAFLQAILPFTLQKLGSYLSSHVNVHIVGSPQSCLKKLVQCGLSPEGLPPVLGGTLDDAGLVEWQKKYGRNFDTAATAPAPVSALDTPITKLPPKTSKKKKVGAATKKGAAKKNARVETEEERVARIRARDRVYWHRKSQKSKIELQVLREQRDEWTAKNAALKEDNERLEGLLKAAQEMIAQGL